MNLCLQAHQWAHYMAVKALRVGLAAKVYSENGSTNVNVYRRWKPGDILNHFSYKGELKEGKETWVDNTTGLTVKSPLEFTPK